MEFNFVKSVFCGLIVFNLLHLAAFADAGIQARSDGHIFYSQNQKSKAILAEQGSQYNVISNSRKLYTVDTVSPFLLPPKDYCSKKIASARDLGFRGGEAYISNDGSVLVWLLLPTFYGHVILYDTVNTKTEPNHPINVRRNDELLKTPALALFRNGRLVKTYDLLTLLKRPELVQQTASHTNWLRDPSLPDFYGAGPSLSPDGKSFTFETSSYRHYALDTFTGEFIQADDMDFWKKSDLIVFGRLTPSKTRKHYFSIGSAKIAKGSSSQQQLGFFDSTKTYPTESVFWSGAALVRRGNHYFTQAPFSSFPPGWGLL
ncbi:MAG: hypothetical protein K2X27_01515 [Candidatus Obscuribacterales bacterium]|nr:hypothetical protein [Candidatus Obscuribacterales bacterium]